MKQYGIQRVIACGVLIVAAQSSAAETTLFYLDLSGQVMRADAEGRNVTAIVKNLNGQGPDGIAVDAAAGHVYWTNMGKVSQDDGSIMRADLDGNNVVTLVAPGGTFTPKQLKLDTLNKKIYWSDREGMRVMRANLDGSKIETLVIAGSGDADRKDQSKWCVGLAIDVPGGKVYWTQKGGDNAGQGTIKRANLEFKAGENAMNRSDIEVLFANLPEPIDLELDLKRGHLYWTDRGDNTVSRAPLNPPAGFDPAKRTDRQILVRGMREAIGIALDERRGWLYYTSLAGELGTARLDGKKSRLLIDTASNNGGRFTGIAVMESKSR